MKNYKIILFIIAICVFTSVLFVGFSKDKDAIQHIYVEDYIKNEKEFLAVFLETPFPKSNLTYEEKFKEYDINGTWNITQKMNGDFSVAFKGCYNNIVPESLVVEYTFYLIENNKYFYQCTYVSYFGGGV